MQFTKTKLALALAGVALFGAQAVWAGPDAVTGDLVKFGDGPGTTAGGEFFVDNLSYGGTVDFITFCLERDEYIDFSSTFKVGNVSTAAVNGGVGGPSPDPLSYETAYLYTQYRAGTLSNYVGDDASANALQSAIWYLEDEIGSVSGQAATWVAEAQGVGWTNIGNVRVMNVEWLNGTHAQDQLMMIPEPETYAMLLAGLGLMGFVARRRQRKLAAAA